MNYKKIKLPYGLHAKVDKEDFNYLNKFNWGVRGNGRCLYPSYDKQTRKTGREVVWMHRVVMGLKRGDKRKVDHIFGDTLDVRKSKLRICNNFDNSHNRKKYKATSSKYKGVQFENSPKFKFKKWKAVIRLNYRSYYLGHYLTEKEAARAYNTGAKKYFGKFCSLNKI